MKIQEGYLTEKSGSWVGHFSRWVTDYATGERKRQQRAFVIGPTAKLTKTKARAHLRERLVKELGMTADARATVSWFVEHRWQPMREGTWRDSTRQTNLELLKIITDRFGTTALEDMDGVVMQAWLNGLAKKRSASAVRHLRIFLRSILNEATEQDHCQKNPARLLRLPKLKKSDRAYLSLEQVKDLVEAATEPRERTLLRLILVTALRPSELFAIRWKCVDFETDTLTITETVYRGKLRPFTKTTEEGETERVTLHIPHAAFEALALWIAQAKYCDNDDFVFPNAEGGFITKENYTRRVLSPLGVKAGIKRLNFQILRRTVATHAQHLGSPKDIQTIMRHKKAETAQAHYVQVIEESVKETTENLAGKLLSPRAKRKTVL